MELAQLFIDQGGEAAYRVLPDGEGVSSMDRFFNRMDEIQRSPSRVKGGKAHVGATGAAQSAAVPPVDPPKPRAANDADLDKMFGKAQPGRP